MVRKGLRRLELKLPDDHPIWSFPPRTRAPVARAYLDLIPELVAHSKLLEEALNRLERIERMLASGGCYPALREERERDQEFDVAGFFGAFDIE
ncbi:MAG: hypothetical protein AB1426_12380 [Bacillota bacterium]